MVLGNYSADVSGDPASSQAAWIRHDGDGEVQSRQGGVVAAVDEHASTVREDVEDGLPDSCVYEVRLVFAWLPSLPALPCIVLRMSYHCLFLVFYCFLASHSLKNGLEK